MIAFVLMVGLVVLGIAAILGWTANSRDDVQKLWPLERAQTDNAPPGPCDLRSRPASPVDTRKQPTAL
jgi:hypothetical protein